jgi:IS4 transposase
LVKVLFDVMAKIMQAKALFILRGKEKVLYRIVEKLPVVANLPACFQALTDELVLFSNDPQQKQVRLITFQVCGSLFRLVTNRFDLTTRQVIMLYAYRWQVELFFKFIRRTLNGLHLLNQSHKGVEIQFYTQCATLFRGCAALPRG